MNGNRATAWSFRVPGILAIILVGLLVISGVLSLFVLVGSGLMASGLLFLFYETVVAIFLNCGWFVLLLSSGIPALYAFFRHEPKRYWSLLLPGISALWLATIFLSNSDNGFPDLAGAKEKSRTESRVGVVKEHFGPFGLEFYNYPYIDFQGKRVPLRWVSIPEDMVFWKDYQVMFYDPGMSDDGNLLVASSSGFNETEYLAFFEYLQLHRKEIADDLEALMRTKERVARDRIQPFREHIGMVLGEDRRFHSDPPGFMVKVSMEGMLRSERWSISPEGKVGGVSGGDVSGQLAARDGKLVLFLDGSSGGNEKGVEYFGNLIQSDHSPGDLPPGWNRPGASRLRDFVEIREFEVEDALVLYQWRLTSMGGGRSVEFDLSGGVTSEGAAWGRWSIDDGGVVTVETPGSSPIRFEAKNMHNMAGTGKHRAVSLQRGQSMALRRIIEEREASYNAASGGRQQSPEEMRSNRNPTRGEPYENVLKMKFVPLPEPAGKGPANAILFAQTETTRGEFQRFLVLTEYPFQKLGGGMPRTHPVIGVTWADANAFCEWLTEVEILSGTLAPGQRYRLPTDHEWSRAAGIADREDPELLPMQKTKKLPGVYLWGEAWPPPKDAGNFSGEELSGFQGKAVINGFEDGFRKTSPVRSFPPNSLGIYDLAGNVWEWCENDYDKEGARKTLRGGSYFQAKQLEVAHRKASDPEAKIGHYGFRCVLDLEGSQLAEGSGGGVSDKLEGNGDGKLPKEENPEIFWTHIEEADKDNDGAETSEEIKGRREGNDTVQRRRSEISDVREKLMSLNEEQRKQIFETMKELQESNPEMSEEERRQRMLKEVEKVLKTAE
jgi:formylglycine-generating enzyme required for sulfatase activity